MPSQISIRNKPGLETAFGLWKKRKDTKDSTQWVSKVRRKMSLRPKTGRI
ncbi:hypothetical protein HY085_03805 [Candidatus Gottesmanbacteria bacterium]|nr:hypothetical protein [Candidatus Gottesmanbacteria bacterium]